MCIEIPCQPGCAVFVCSECMIPDTWARAICHATTEVESFEPHVMFLKKIIPKSFTSRFYCGPESPQPTFNVESDPGSFNCLNCSTATHAKGSFMHWCKEGSGWCILCRECCDGNNRISWECMLDKTKSKPHSHIFEKGTWLRPPTIQSIPKSEGKK